MKWKFILQELNSWNKAKNLLFLGLGRHKLATWSQDIIPHLWDNNNPTHTQIMGGLQINFTSSLQGLNSVQQQTTGIRLMTTTFQVLIINFLPKSSILKALYSKSVLKKLQKQPFADNLQKMFLLKILQYSQENTCVGVSF